MIELDQVDKQAAAVLEGYLVRKDLVRTFRGVSGTKGSGPNLQPSISCADLRGGISAGTLLR